MKRIAMRIWPWLTKARNRHDRFLVLSMAGFNFTGGWDQLVLKSQMRDWR